VSEDTGSATSNEGDERRRHARQRVLKSALLYPVLREARLAIHDVSQNGLSGECALTLGLGQEVHVSLDGETFVTAEVRWVEGMRCGLQTEDPLPRNLGGQQAGAEEAGSDQREAPRVKVDLLATLVACAPVFAGTVRNMSAEGMMIEAAGLPEGTRLLVKARGCDVRMGRVQWSSGGMAGVFFEPVAAGSGGK